MEYSAIIAAVDAELARLQEIRNLLARSGKIPEFKLPAASRGTKTKSPKRRLTAEGRARIAEAQKRRWAMARKSSRKAA